MTRLTYAGGLDTLSLPDPENPAGPPIFEEIMHPGATHDVPDHPITTAWRARGLLVEPEEAGPAEVSPVPDISQVSREASKVRQRRAEAPAAATVGDPPGEPQE